LRTLAREPSRAAALDAAVAGEEVLRRLKGDPQTSETPVVVISAHATHGQSERLRAGGAADYLTKPFDVARLLAIVDESAPGREPGDAGERE
jgi:CheY-like chemotaxis protein